MFIFGKLEGSGAMWLQPIGIPDPMHRRRADAMDFGHRPHTPMSGSFGSRMQRSFHNFLNLGASKAPLFIKSESLINVDDESGFVFQSRSFFVSS